MRKVTQDIKMVYQISDIDEILLWDKLVIELERKEHSLESIKETDEFLALSQSFARILITCEIIHRFEL